MSFAEFKEYHDTHILTTYGRYPVCFVKGSGAMLWDSDGREYIDFSAGIGVNSVGYAHPKWVEAVTAQAGILAHVSNLYYTEPGAKLAEKLCKLSGMSGVFFANSGAESNEGLIKLARKYSRDKYGEGRSTILTLTGSFHGRTVTTLAATGQEVFHKNFDPFTPGFRHVAPGDIDALNAAGGDVCGLLMEPIQGEGGVLPLDKEYVLKAAQICAERDWLLLCDEVQTGVGRTGTWFGFQGLDIKPDAVSFAKGIAGGLPFGGFMAGDKLKDVLGPGDHATTFGGTPLCAAAALATLEILEPVLPQVAEKGDYIRNKIEAMNLKIVAGTRGRGLMIGVKIAEANPKEVNLKLLEAGLVALTAGSDAVRLLPPLTITAEEIDKGLSIFEKTLKEF